MTGERMNFDSAIVTIQQHLVRYVWALKWCVGKRVLDAGCGAGYGTWLLAHVAREAIGIDCAAEAVAKAQERYGAGVKAFRAHRIEDIGTQHPFDTVVCLEVLEHLDDMEVGLAKLLELTAPDGTLLLSVPVRQGLNAWHHGRDYSVADWDALMAGRGVEQTRFYQPCGGEVASFSNCEIQYRTTSTETADGYSLYVVKKGLS